MSVVVAGALLMAAVATASAASPTRLELLPGDAPCDPTTQSDVTRVEPAAAGTYPVSHLGEVYGSIEVEVLDTADGPAIDFDPSSDVRISAVLVKGGPNAHLYIYEPAIGADEGLHAPEVDGTWPAIDHLCFFSHKLELPPPPPSEEPSPPPPSPEPPSPSPSVPVCVPPNVPASVPPSVPGSVPPDGPDCVPPSPPATFTTLITTPVCDGDVPKLTYQVAVTGTTSNTVTITWVNPNGDDVVMTGLPLSGTVLWPGAIELNGEPVDWPGWSFVDGPDADSVPDQWVEGDEFDWVRPSVTIIISVNPEASMSVAYPPSSPDCATEPEGAVRGVTGPGITPPPTDGLGAEVRPASGFGLPLILLGLAAVVLAIGFVVPMPATERRRIDEDR